MINKKYRIDLKEFDYTMLRAILHYALMVNEGIIEIGNFPVKNYLADCEKDLIKTLLNDKLLEFD